MNRRIRVLAALLALFAFSAYFGESVWAALCPPGMDAHAAHAGEVADAADAHAGMHHAPPAPEADPGSTRSDAPACPLGMAGAGGSCVGVSLPARTDVLVPAPAEHATASIPLDDSHDLLLVAAHFRPPRA
jgi:hypothetical protein